MSIIITKAQYEYRWHRLLALPSGFVDLNQILKDIE